MIRITKNNHPVMAFITGLLSANNIIYLFVVGSTPIMLSCIYASACLVYLFFIHDENLSTTFANIPQSLKIFFVFIILSLIPILVFHHQYSYQWLVGLIELLLYCCIALVVASLDNNRQQLLSGIFLGLIINFAFVIYAYYMYRRGVVYSLNDIFPAVHMKVLYIGNAFRGWGLFKEPGHLMRYICILCFVVWEYISNKSVAQKIAMLLSIAVLVMFSISSAVIILIIGIVIYINLKSKRNIKLMIGSIIGIIVAVSIVLLLARNNQFISLLVTSFQSGVTDIFSTTGGNATRYSGMDYVLQVIRNYPIIGSGWNTLTQVFIEEGYYGVGNVRGSYSEGFTLIAELGIFCLPYFVFLWKSIIKELKCLDSYSVALGTGLLLYLILLFITDYSIDSGSAILIGLTILSNKERNNHNVYC